MQPQLPCRLCADVADALASADSLPSASEGIVAALFSTFLAESVILTVDASSCARIAGRANDFRERDWGTYLSGMSEAASIGLIPETAERAATFVDLGRLGSRRVFAVIDGNVLAYARELSICAAIIRLGFAAAWQRDQAREQGRLLRRGYRLLLAASRARGLDEVADVVTTQLGAVLNAGRLSLARYNAQDDSLQLIAARGCPPEVAASVTVRPGEWVMGHVHQSGRTLVVNDAAELPAPAHHRSRYGPAAFAVVPLTHRRTGVGVLSITDKRDRSRFTRDEQFVLRLLGPVLGALVSAADRDDEIERLRYAATVDSLTGLHNRAYLERRLNEEVGRSRREQGALAVLMVDIDNFKTINDRRGHSAGDEVLRHVGEVIRSAVRVFDVCARYGGDEFVIVMPNSDSTIAQACAERIRSRTAQSLENAALMPLTLSVGVATMHSDSTPLELIERADRALYAAKASGKNAVRLDSRPHAENSADETTSEPPPDSDSGPLLLPYMLVVDADSTRAPLYRREADTARIGLLLARDGPHAVRVMEQFGAPAVLIVDLTADHSHGLTALEWFEGKHTGTRIIALSESAALRRYVRSAGHATNLVVVRPGRIRAALAALASSASPAARDGTVGSAVDRSAQERSAPASDWYPELLERSRGEFEVARERARARREHRQLSIVLFDVSPRSDGEGHASESGELTAVAQTLVRVVRPSDLPIRWSNHELLLVLPGLTGHDARAVAERVRAAMQAGAGHRVAVSGGVAEIELNEQFGSVVDRARQRVVLALNQGHNRVG